MLTVFEINYLIELINESSVKIKDAPNVLRVLQKLHLMTQPPVPPNIKPVATTLVENVPEPETEKPALDKNT